MKIIDCTEAECSFTSSVLLLKGLKRCPRRGCNFIHLRFVLSYGVRLERPFCFQRSEIGLQHRRDTASGAV
jgi:hypothetical protein